MLTSLTDVSVFAVNVITLIGLGMAIDYSLFVGQPVPGGAGRRTPDRRAAIERTMATAGRTVLVSGLTIALALASLLIFPQVFLRSMGFGGMAAVLVAMLAALTVLPALLAVLGPPDQRAARCRCRGAAPAVRRATAAWARIARSVMRRPVLYAVGVSAVLLAARRCRSCACSGAASTSGCCRPAPRPGWSPSGSRAEFPGGTRRADRGAGLAADGAAEAERVAAAVARAARRDRRAGDRDPRRLDPGRR